MGMTQARVAAEIGMDQSRLSKWEDGTAVPSAEAWFNLAAFAARKGDTSSAFLFWEQAGLKAEDLASLAEVFLRKGDVKMGAILSTAETILKERVADLKALEDEGKAVLVPPFAEGEWESQASAPPLPVPANKVANKASTYYLIAKPTNVVNTLGNGFAPKDWIVFDTTAASARKIETFRGRVVLVNFTRPTKQTPESRDWPMGLVLGRLGVLSEASASYIFLARIDNPEWMLHRQTTLLLDWFNPWDRIPEHIREHIDKGLRYPEYRNFVRSTESEELATRTFPEGCNLMGRFIALFDGGSAGKWNQDEISG